MGDDDANEPLEMDYGSDDGVAGASAALGDASEWSERTSALVDNVRNYVDAMEEEGTERGDEKVSAGEFLAGIDGGEDLADGMNLLMQSNEGGDALVKTTEVEGHAMLREFTIEEEDDDVYRTGRLGFEEYDIDGRNRQVYGAPKMRYRHAWLRDKRIKRGICMIAVGCVLIAMISTVSKVRKERSLPDWNKDIQELMEEEKEENGHLNKDGSVAAVPSEPLQQYPETASSHSDSDHYRTITQQYAPRWFSRADGYESTAWEESLVFCARQDMMIPCPYEAVCPDGPNKAPYGGEYMEEPLGSWAPVFDDENGWVQVSSGDAGGGGGHDDETNNGCMWYADLHGEDPDWGESGGNEEQTRHILCCKPDSAVIDEVEEMGPEPGDYESSEWPPPEFNPNLLHDPSATTTEAPLSDVVSDGGPEIGTGTSVADALGQPAPVDEAPEALIASEYAAAERHSPTWYGRDAGWLGRTYSDAMKFCESLPTGPRGLCPYHVVCPTGPNHIPYGGMVDGPNESWVPTSDSYDNFVQVGNVGDEKICVPYMQEYLTRPEWGLTGEDDEKITRYVVCCTIDDEDNLDVASSVLSTTAATTTTTTTAKAPSAIPTSNPTPEPTAKPTSNPTLEPTAKPTGTPPKPTAKPSLPPMGSPTDVPDSAKYGLVAEEYGPIWYHRSTGWTGQTYQEAIDFCNAQVDAVFDEPMTLCPYEAYCPLGDGRQPFEGVKEGGPKGSWAPIVNGANEWVELGSEEMCKLYADLYPNIRTPIWGITGNFDEDMTRYVMCCRSTTGHLGTHATATKEEPPAAAPSSPALVDSAVGVVTEGIAVGGELQELYSLLYNMIEHKVQPVPHSRDGGWHGQRYDEARSFCASEESKEPCNYETLCPNGMGGEDLSFEEGPVWAPIAPEGGVETWAELRSGGYCMKRTALAAAYQDVSRYVLCCATAGEQMGPGEDHGDIPFNIINGGGR